MQYVAALAGVSGERPFCPAALKGVSGQFGAALTPSGIRDGPREMRFEFFFVVKCPFICASSGSKK